MQFLRNLVIAATLATGSLSANATLIDLADFDGTESVINFDDAVTNTGFTGVFTSQGVSIAPASDSYIIQYKSGTSIFGTTGHAFSTFGVYDESGVFSTTNNDVTLTFENSISRFGMNFGTHNNLPETLSAVVTAFDANGNIIESASIMDFYNTFLGFDFSSAVSRIVIDRIDTSTYVTFIDDVRFVNAAVSTSVPEPSSLMLFIAALGCLISRRRKR